ncbi:MAG TPA: chloride channel protein [Propionibacteriaceae bacterium]|nr:chloride channel protein [Propionibacteriaceae bacterium]
MSSGRVATRVALVTLITGVLSGLVGAFMTLLLKLVQWLSLGVAPRVLITDPHAVPAWRLVLAPLVGCAFAGIGWWWLRANRTIVPVRRAVEPGSRAMGWWTTFADASLQIIMVGSGGSLGREGAPRQAAAAAADTVARRLTVSEAWRTVLVASAAGAGLAAVYNVPISGVVFAMEVALHRWSPRIALVAAVTSGVATVVAWPVISTAPTYHFPPFSLSLGLAAALLASVPLWSVVGVGMVSLVAPARKRAIFHGGGVAWLVAAAGLVLGIVTIWLPVATGNGKEMVQLAFLLPVLGSAGLFGLLAVAKPVLSAGFIVAGAEGGMITPSMATGAAAAAAVLLALGHPAVVPVAALVGAGCVLAVTQNAPIFAGVMAWELTHAGLAVGVLVMASAALSWLVARLLRHWSKLAVGARLPPSAGGVQAENLGEDERPVTRPDAAEHPR